MTERLIEYRCGTYRVFGILSLSDQINSPGLLMIGRTGNDRQATLFARHAQSRGISSFRFDLRGRAENEGPLVTVEESSDDIAAALNAFQLAAPWVTSFAIWGISEGSAAALLYAPGDPRISALILGNPWIRMEDAVAKQHLRQVFAKTIDPGFWIKIGKSEAGFKGAARSLMNLVVHFVKARSRSRTASGPAPLKDRVVEGLRTFDGAVCIILSGEDPATEVFLEVAREHLDVLRRTERLAIHSVPDANHMFSRSDWRAKLFDWASDWVLERVPVYRR
jgi:uncharacterized protein